MQTTALLALFAFTLSTARICTECGVAKFNPNSVGNDLALLEYVGTMSMANPMPVVLDRRAISNMRSIIFNWIDHMNATGQLINVSTSRAQTCGIARLYSYELAMRTCFYVTSKCTEDYVMPVPRAHMWFFAYNSVAYDSDTMWPFVQARRCSSWPLVRPPWFENKRPMPNDNCDKQYLKDVRDKEGKCGMCHLLPYKLKDEN